MCGEEEMERKESKTENKSTINTNINHAPLLSLSFFPPVFFPSPLLFVSTNIRCRGLTSWRGTGHLLNHVCPDISEDIHHVGKTLTLTETCGLKYIPSERTFVMWYLFCRGLATLTATALHFRNITYADCFAVLFSVSCFLIV